MVTVFSAGWYKIVEDKNSTLKLMEVDLNEACCGESRRQWVEVGSFKLDDLAKLLKERNI